MDYRSPADRIRGYGSPADGDLGYRPPADRNRGFGSAADGDLGYRSPADRDQGYGSPGYGSRSHAAPDRGRRGYPDADDRGRGIGPDADESGRAGYRDADDRSRAERASREPGSRGTGRYDQPFAAAASRGPGGPERRFRQNDGAEPAPGNHGAPPRTNHGGPGRFQWNSRSRLVLIIAAAAAVISLGSWQLVAARVGSNHSPSPSSLAGARSPKAGPSGAHPSGGTSPNGTAGATVTIDWVGDMTFGAPGAWPPDGTGSLLDAVTGDLHSDLTMGNLESALGDLPMTKCSPGESDCYQFEAPDNTAQALKQDGFSAVNVANNHTLDAGSAGEASTNSVLQQAGLYYAGRPGQITYLTRNGITIALLGFAPWSYDADALDIAAAEALVREAKQHAQVVIVMEHLGAEGPGAQHVTDSEEYFLGQDRGNSVAFTHGVIDAGADLVVGSGPHVLRGFQWYHGHLIAYSLGNFCGYNTLGLDSVTSVSAILHVTLGAQGQFVAGSITPLRLVAPGTPEPDRTGAAIGTINSLSQDDFGGNGAAVISDTGTIESPAAG